MPGKSLDEVYRRIESERQQRIQQNILKESRSQELSEMVRQELLRRNRMYEFVNNNNTSTAAAGAGGGSLKSEQNIFISKHDKSGIYLEVTSNVEYILGYNESDLLDKSAYDFFNPKCHLNIVRSHVSKNTETVRYQIRSKNDDYIWVETTSYKMSDGNIYCITRKLSFFEIIIENIIMRNRKHIQRLMNIKKKLL